MTVGSKEGIQLVKSHKYILMCLYIFIYITNHGESLRTKCAFREFNMGGGHDVVWGEGLSGKELL